MVGAQDVVLNWDDEDDRVGVCSDEKYTPDVYPWMKESMRLDECVDLGRARAFLANTLARMRSCYREHASRLEALLTERQYFLLQHMMAHRHLAIKKASGVREDEMYKDETLTAQSELLNERTRRLFAADEDVNTFVWYFGLLRDDAAAVRERYPQLAKSRFFTI